MAVAGDFGDEFVWANTYGKGNADLCFHIRFNFLGVFAGFLEAALNLLGNVQVCFVYADLLERGGVGSENRHNAVANLLIVFMVYMEENWV